MEVMEDYTALEEEGVTNLKRSKYAIREVCAHAKCHEFVSHPRQLISPLEK